MNPGSPRVTAAPRTSPGWSREAPVTGKLLPPASPPFTGRGAGQGRVPGTSVSGSPPRAKALPVHRIPLRRPPLPGYRDTVCPPSPVPVPLRGQEQRGGPATLRGADRRHRPLPAHLTPPQSACAGTAGGYSGAPHGALGLRSARTPSRGHSAPTDSATPLPRGPARRPGAGHESAPAHQGRAPSAAPTAPPGARLPRDTPRDPHDPGPTALSSIRLSHPLPFPPFPTRSALPPPSRAPASRAPPPRGAEANGRAGRQRGGTRRCARGPPGGGVTSPRLGAAGLR